MTNPIHLELPDLILLKKEVEAYTLPPSEKYTYSGFGQGKSLFKSRGLNFQEVRQYQAGDDIRQIDWRVTAKYGKPFTKLYEEEKEQQVHVVCDLRKPMHFASQGHFKSVIAGRLAALCAFLAEQKNDTFTYQILADKLYSVAPSSTNEVIPQFLNQLSELNQFNDLPFNTLFNYINQNVPSGSLIFFISDFHNTNLKDLELLGQLSKRNTIILIHIYDMLEVSLPEGIFPCSDGIKELNVDTSTENFKKNFNTSWVEQTFLLRQEAQKYGFGYLSLRTDSPYINQFKNFCLGE